MRNFRETIREIRSIARRETGLLRGDRIYLFAMVIAPILCAVFFLSLMSEGLPTGLPIAVVDQDGTSVSRNIVRQIDAFEQSDVVAVGADFHQARKMMQRGEVYGILVLPEGLARKTTLGEQPR